MDLMRLSEFYDYKNKLMEHLLSSPEIVNLIDEDGITVEHARSLAYKRVFPYEYVPDTVQEGKTFICFDVDIQCTNGKTFLSPTIFIWVFAHKSKLRLPEGGVRTDKLCEEIDKVINGSREYGLGELNLYAVKRFAPMTDFQGKLMIFHAKDFNRTYDGKQYTPDKRGTWQ